MRLPLALLGLLISFSSFAKGVSYDYCQQAINNTFNVDRLLKKQSVLEEFEAGKPYKNEEAKLERLNELYKDEEYKVEGHIGAPNKESMTQKPLFKIDENGKLVPDEKLVTVSLYNEQTGEYQFRINGSEKTNAVALGSFIIKKDEDGRIYSIEESGNDLRCKKCKLRLEMSYSKKTCVPKKILSLDKQNQGAVLADAEICKNLDDIQRQLYKRMNKLDKCMNALNEHYQNTVDVSEVMLTKIQQMDDPETSYIGGNLSRQLESINELSKELKEKDQEFETRYEQQRNFQTQYNDLLNQCNAYLGKDVVGAKKIYKEKSGIFEIKKEKKGNRVDDPFDGTVIKN